MIWLVLLIISLFIFFTRTRKYSWEDFSKRFGTCVGEFGVYDTHKKTSEALKITGMYNTFFKKPRPEGKTYMLKIAETNAKGPEKKILEYVKPLTQGYEYYNVIVRIQTNPWRMVPHFDSMNQIVRVLSGSKRWLLWDRMDVNGDEDTFLKDINHLDFKDMQAYLDTHKIPYKTKVTKVGHVFNIPFGTWHYVENINTTKGCIMINMHMKNFDRETDKRFNKLWPIQHARCMNNTFY
jgi:hypothetical protein